MSEALRLEVAAPGPRRARRPQRKSERTRRRILTAAKALFDRRGYRDTTIDHITKRAGVAHGTFYLYFADKSEVLQQLMAQAFAEFDQIASREVTRAEEIAALVRESLETYQRNQLLMRLLREASATDAYFRHHYDEHFLGALVEHVQRSITHIHEQFGIDGSPIDARTAARAVVGMVESFAYGMFIGGEAYSIDTAVETLTRICAGAIGLSI